MTILHPQETLIETHDYNGIPVDIVKWKETLWCGKLGYAANNIDEPDVEAIAGSMMDMVQSGSAMKQCESDWEVCISLNYLSKERPNGVMFGSLVHTDQQPAGYDLLHIQSGIYARIQINTQTALALERKPWTGGIPPYEWIGAQIAPEIGYCYGNDALPIFEYYGPRDPVSGAHQACYLYVPVQKAIQPWDHLQKQLTLQQLGHPKGLRILDFGSGNGLMANLLAEFNEVIAVEPSADMLKGRHQSHPYQQLHGDIETLATLPSESFDLILCHNVLEYAAERQEILRELCRLLKPEGQISVLKHNRPGRIMQMVVLLNDFEKAHALLNGENGQSQEFGAIHYYEDTDLTVWAPQLHIHKVLGMRTFWDLQQNQAIQKDKNWQEQMMQMEQRASDIPEYQAIAFFHHVLLTK